MFRPSGGVRPRGTARGLARIALDRRKSSHSDSQGGACVEAALCPDAKPRSPSARRVRRGPVPPRRRRRRSGRTRW
ncbi:DUF397 domain-containing protein [Streptomyces sp. CHD11]|nr:DUF397 domain-containing protein [Streptomyces sp. CHD11]